MKSYFLFVAFGLAIQPDNRSFRYIVRIKPELLDNSELQQMRSMLEARVGKNEACIRALGTGLSNPPTTIVDIDWVEKAEYTVTRDRP